MKDKIRSAQIVLPCENLNRTLEFFTSLFCFNQTSHLAETCVVDAVNQKQMFGFAKSAEFFAVSDDFGGGFLADVRDFNEFFDRRRINIYGIFRQRKRIFC